MSAFRYRASGAGEVAPGVHLVAFEVTAQSREPDFLRDGPALYDLPPPPASLTMELRGDQGEVHKLALRLYEFLQGGAGADPGTAVAVAHPTGEAEAGHPAPLEESAIRGLLPEKTP